MVAKAALKPISAQHDPVEHLAVFNKAGSDPLRLEVLRVLHHHSFGVLELCHILDVKQSALSHHLKILAQAELVDTRREGNSIFYRRLNRHNDDPLRAMQQALFDGLDALTLPRAVLARIKQVQQERASRSRDFFREQADSFEIQQERIATHAFYGAGVMDLLRTANLQNFHTALEVGPGNGEFLVELAPLFKQVIALDNSREMLLRAKAHAAQHQLDNIQFLQGDTDQAIQKRIEADCVVLNMVLHHTAAPADIFTDLFKLTRRHGMVLVTELCRHQQDWVKEACGDLWLGFEPEELLHWAQNAGFIIQQSVYQALRNGFQIQLHCLRKNVLNQSL